MTPWELAKTSEHSHQRALFAWCNMAERCGIRVANNPLAYTGLQANLNGIPQLKWIHAIHNQGHGDAVHGGQAKAEGVKAGVADIFLPYPTDRNAAYCGLYIELKVGKNKPTTEQNEFITDMLDLGYYACWVTGWEAARDKIVAYLGLG